MLLTGQSDPYKNTDARATMHSIKAFIELLEFLRNEDNKDKVLPEITSDPHFILSSVGPDDNDEVIEKYIPGLSGNDGNTEVYE